MKWFLSSLKAQQYAGRKPSEGIKKPLNAFLGELFLGSCGEGDEECRLVSEQVSHHPPVTACYLWAKGVRAEGYTRQEITFSGSVNIQQIGHAVLTLDDHNEHYLIPLPNIKVKGILTGGPYPELSGTYSIVSSSGYIAEIDFSGKTFLGFGGSKNHVNAIVHKIDDKDRSHALYTAEGSWAESFTIKDAQNTVIDTYDVAAAPPTAFRTLPLEQQDPWESRNAWKGVISAVHSGSMQGVANAKTELEGAQRALRRKDETSEEQWEALFFRREGEHEVAERLLELQGKKLDVEGTCGCWKFDAEAAASRQRPWRGDLTPFGRR